MTYWNWLQCNYCILHNQQGEQEQEWSYEAIWERGSYDARAGGVVSRWLQCMSQLEKHEWISLNISWDTPPCMQTDIFCEIWNQDFSCIIILYIRKNGPISKPHPGIVENTFGAGASEIWKNLYHHFSKMIEHFCRRNFFC